MNRMHVGRWGLEVEIASALQDSLPGRVLLCVSLALLNL